MYVTSDLNDLGKPLFFARTPGDSTWSIADLDIAIYTRADFWVSRLLQTIDILGYLLGLACTGWCSFHECGNHRQ